MQHLKDIKHHSSIYFSLLTNTCQQHKIILKTAYFCYFDTKKIGGIKLFKLAIKYALFAAISTIGNLVTQQLCLMFFDYLVFLKSFENVSILGLFNLNLVLMAAICMGTLVGLIIKYILDKKYIFNYKTKSKSEDTGKFIMYSLWVYLQQLYFGLLSLYSTVFSTINMPNTWAL